MNAIGVLLVWTALQVTLFCLLGIGLYSLARRHSPAAGAWAATAVLLVVMGISALALSPWPRWWTASNPSPNQVALIEPSPAEGIAPIGKDSAATVATPENPARHDSTAPASDRAASPRPEAEGGWRAFLSNLGSNATESGTDAAVTAWRWPAWVAVAILIGCFIGLARLLVAVVALGGYRRQTRGLSDPALLELVDQLRGELRCTRLIELREVSALCSPSTVGWLRPMIILPGDWRQWSAEERRAILAHEVAHVARADFAVWLVAQLGVVLHFYNPLVHWLASRLRLEQELAADICGARIAGGPQPYLITLAQMALRQSAPPASWAARPFLPTRGTLMRRIEMLHGQKLLPSLSLSRTRRAGLVMVLVIVGCFIAGFRGPTASHVVSAAPPEQAAATAPFNLDFVPNDAQVVFALRPAELAKLKSLDSLIKALLQQLGPFEPLGLPLEAIEEFKFVTGGQFPNDTTDPEKAVTDPEKVFWEVLVIRAKQPHDWSKLVQYFLGDSKEMIGAGQKYFESVQPQSTLFRAYWLPDDRTIVLAPTSRITRTFSLRGNLNGPAWADQWNAGAKGPAAMMLKMSVFAYLVHAAEGNLAKEAPDFSNEADVVLLSGAQAAGGFQVAGTLECRSAEGAERIHQELQAAFAAFKERFESRQASHPAATGPDVQIARIFMQLIDATKIDARQATLRSQTLITANVGRDFQQAIGPARAAARRALSINKMKHIALALYGYDSIHKQFPPAVVLGPDGKTPHSWRLELLPFMEVNKKDVYDRYKMDEPWDSEHNLTLVKEAADVFSVPTETPNEDCGYFLVTGPGTAWDPAGTPSNIRTVRDGAANTIGFVEAKRSVPWTKPEDIEYDPDKPIPKLGGFFEEGFAVGFMSGSIHVFANDFDEATLRALFTKNGREIIKIDPQTGLPSLDQ